MFIRLSALGDVVHTLPAAQALKNYLPDTRISWVAEAPQLELLKNNPVVDEVIEMPKSVWREAISDPGKWLQTSLEVKEFFSDLKKRKFDVSVDFQGLMKSAVVGYAASIPVRLGYKGLKERSDIFYTEKLDVGDFNNPDIHIIEHHLRLSEFLLRVMGHRDVEFKGKPQFSLPESTSKSREKIDLIINQSRNKEKKTVVLIPGTTWETKIWPYDKWASLVEKLAETGDYRFVLVGGPADTKTSSNIVSMINDRSPGATIVDATGKTDLIDLIELFKRSALVIGLDSGPVHLAAAVRDTNVVAIHGATPWGRNRPYGGTTIQLDLSCQPCFKRVCPLGTIECLTDLNAEMVLEHVKRFLD